MMKEQNKYCNIILRQFIIELLEMYLSCPFYQDLFTPTYLKTENGANSNLYHKKSQTFITQLLTPTHAQLQRHRLKFIKKPFKNAYMFRPTTIFRELQYPR